MSRILNGLASLLLLAALAYGAHLLRGWQRDTVAGVATVTDGDSLKVDGATIRLEGLDAPELAQTCFDAQDRPYRCGETARDALSERVARGPLRCTVEGRDRYGRSLAQCDDASGQDVGDALVGQGLAVAYGRSRRYREAEERARLRKLGLWAGRFERPGDYRKARTPHRGEVVGSLEDDPD